MLPVGWNDIVGNLVHLCNGPLRTTVLEEYPIDTVNLRKLSLFCEKVTTMVSRTVTEERTQSKKHEKHHVTFVHVVLLCQESWQSLSH